jgi:hypothetical protein
MPEAPEGKILATTQKCHVQEEFLVLQGSARQRAAKIA